VIEDHFRPLGSLASMQSAISRRAFLGAGIAVPAALAFNSTAWAAPQIETHYDLRFVEDAQGMSVVTWNDEVWQLHRVAFGPSTTFTLRTLRAGSDKGYELEIGGLRFGPMRGRHHLIVFQREGNDLSVRMRSNLWSDANGEIVSEAYSLASW
jgi:hypothetical protein